MLDLTRKLWTDVGWMDGHRWTASDHNSSLSTPCLGERKKNELEALERLYRSTGLIFLQWQKKFLTIIIQSLHFSSLKKKGMEKTCEKRRKKW